MATKSSFFSIQLTLSPTTNLGALRSKISNIEAPQPLNRTLPSLPSLASSLATKDSHPGSPQILQTPDPATNNVQVQYLRREVSAKNVALQALQRDYDNLLANASFQQTHHPASTTGADAPSSWAEERINLQYQVGDLQAQVNDLIKTREEAQKESIASRNQYLQIMSMSSQLQTQTAADVKRWQAEKEEWEKQRLNLLRTIQRLERQVRRTGTGADEDEQHVDDGSVNHLLRGDIEKLEQSCRFLENRMRELDQETAQLDGALRTALHISTSLREKLDQARSESRA
ncbi:hypothetical protein BGW36DRAFT_133948 [Talaromyces proteolyticus]|uniref:Uncharacterized protein n=1 Tax=Talaromyces proteolyticus TaxID=1131652 RepID=A0AAD4KTQ5_9EURO|nr:uncharacterized protein BGW36DRAFT_133948 [Talaromyces proteolyticus]KAH8700663.1 hypothetical protein BGW36DRAFT_133948 [Talaromyces proteolyticus]